MGIAMVILSDKQTNFVSVTGSSYQPLSPTPAYKLVADAIEREILSGRVRPGQAIGTEAELVKQFAVNRSTVREGIRLLEQGGLIRRDSSRRLFACLPRYDRLANRISRALLLHQVTFGELWEATLALEVAVAQSAAEHATPEGLAALEQNLARTREALGNPALLAKLDTEFHALLCQASGNRVLRLAREPESQLLSPTTEVIFSKVPEATPRLIEAHGFIIDAVRRHDGEAAVLWMRRHVKDWRTGFVRAGNPLDRTIDSLYRDKQGESPPTP